jgi:hypothetical protein
VRERIFTKAEGMRVKRDRIPDKVLKEIFPKKLSRSQSSDEVYTQLKTMILSGWYRGLNVFSYPLLLFWILTKHRRKESFTLVVYYTKKRHGVANLLSTSEENSGLAKERWGKAGLNDRV